MTQQTIWKIRLQTKNPTGMVGRQDRPAVPTSGDDGEDPISLPELSAACIVCRPGITTLSIAIAIKETIKFLH